MWIGVCRTILDRTISLSRLTYISKWNTAQGSFFPFLSIRLSASPPHFLSFQKEKVHLYQNHPKKVKRDENREPTRVKLWKNWESLHVLFLLHNLPRSFKSFVFLLNFHLIFRYSSPSLIFFYLDGVACLPLAGFNYISCLFISFLWDCYCFLNRASHFLILAKLCLIVPIVRATSRNLFFIKKIKLVSQGSCS